MHVLSQRRTIVEDRSQLQCLVDQPLVAVLEALTQIVLEVHPHQLQESLVLLSVRLTWSCRRRPRELQVLARSLAISPIRSLCLGNLRCQHPLLALHALAVHLPHLVQALWAADR